MFIPNHCTFQEIGLHKPIGHKYGGMYHQETSVSLVICVSCTSLQDQHYMFCHPILQPFKN